MSDLPNNPEELKSRIEGYFIEIEGDPKDHAPFCVDGRKGKVGGEDRNVYPQALGGSLHAVALNLFASEEFDTFEEAFATTFRSLQEAGFKLGLHRDDHNHESVEASGCGFADNFGTVLQVFQENGEEIRKLLGIKLDDGNWVKIMERVGQVRESIAIPDGEQIIKMGEGFGDVEVQVLEGVHDEAAAVVNKRENTTLDTDKTHGSGESRVFNLDLWYVIQMAESLGISDTDFVEKLSLGLYVATEMVLVEGKGRPGVEGEQRLPIVLLE